MFSDGLERPNNECGKVGWLEGESTEREHKWLDLISPPP
jgi:hypothetical protein